VQAASHNAAVDEGTSAVCRQPVRVDV